MTRIKICGIKQAEHGLVALEAGADFLGFIFYPPSHRYVTPRQVRSIVSLCREQFLGEWQAVGVFVNETIETVNMIAEACNLDAVQLCGDEDPDYCAQIERPVIRVVQVAEDGRPLGPTEPLLWNAGRVLLDTARPGQYGGTGAAFDWTAIRPHAREALLAGGLTVANVGQALREAQPWGLDVSSGVEVNRTKDPELIRRFIEEVKQHDGAR
jgi:indole-3-glycerol phosphate synthase / phosphoribosylanthranilate isomerase